MMQWIKKLFGIRCPERITEELIERLPADKLCRKYIDGELASDMESQGRRIIFCLLISQLLSIFHFYYLSYY
ncbi:hypothetical protein [Bacteroides caecimuris]|uniref:hypothetical protein n=1 Tax=Bacteroides caecimuris TaxID=1796613 RepID=UPI00138F3301|nr:hypothetical protein [Bacteroides caecimuris]NDO58953.1 hypothetical protein [Bacteroides caecimuris]